MGIRIPALLLVASGCVGPAAEPVRPPGLEAVAAVAEASPQLRARLDAPTFFEHEGDAFITHARPRDLGTSLPAVASGPWRLAHGEGDRIAMEARLEGAMPVAGELVDGAVVYPAIHRSTDAVVTANRDQVELFYVLYDDVAPRSWRWVTSPADGTWRACDSGAELIDHTGHVRFHATRPVAFDRDGTVLAMAMHVEGDVLRYELVGSSHIEWPVVVDPGFDIAYWEQRHDPFPLPLVAPAFVYDETNAETLLYGGSNLAVQDDTWTWDGEQWQRHTPATRPPPLLGASAVSDPERGVVWMYGGSDGREARSDLWQWDGSEWTLVAREPAPGPMPHSAMAFDPSSRTVLLYGGALEPGTADWRGETWRWDGASWSRLGPPTTEPSCSRACSMVFESPGRALLVNASAPSLGTWLWDGVSWTMASTWTAAFAPQRLVIDEVGVLGLGTLDPYGWTRGRWDGSTWTPVGERGGFVDFRPMPGGVYDRARGRPLLYGGRDDWTRPMGDLMEHDGIRWRLRSPTASFRSQTYHSVVLPPEGGHPVVWDGERAQRWTGDAFVAGESLADFLALTSTTTGDVYGLRARGTDTELVRRRAGVWTTLDTAPTPVGTIGLAVHESSGVVLLAMFDEHRRTLWSWEGAWSRGATVVADRNGWPQLVYDVGEDVVLLLDGGGATNVWSPGGGWVAASGGGGRAVGTDGLGSVLSLDVTGTFEWTPTGWNRLADGSPLLGVIVHDPSTGRTLLVSSQDGSVYRLGTDRWIPVPVRSEVLDFPGYPAATVVVDRDSGRTVVDRIRSIVVDRAWVYRPTGSVFDGARWLSGVGNAAYAGPGRGVLLIGEGVWRWTSAGIDPVPSPPGSSLLLLGYDRATDRVVGVASGATLSWDGTAWESSGEWRGSGSPDAATEPVSGVLHVLAGGRLWRWSAGGFVHVEDLPDATGLGAHDPRGSLVLFGFRDSHVTVREGPPWVERDVRGELPPGVQRNGAYHGPTDSVLTSRHRLRLLSGVGLPCAGPGDCGGGFCVDGVCCDDPCGGGARDCMACSIAEGGAMDGHCGPLAAGLAETIECRPSRDACDSAERCTSESSACPGDAAVPDGTSCADGLGCNGAETCRGGFCAPGATLCDDADPCTIDGCDEPGRCIHLVRPACCSVDADCRDADGCTHDRCVEGTCLHEAACSDAGVDGGVDAGAVSSDAGGDASVVLPDVSGDAGPVIPPAAGVSGGACGCRVAARVPGPSALLALVIALLSRPRRRAA